MINHIDAGRIIIEDNRTNVEGVNTNRPSNYSNKYNKNSNHESINTYKRNVTFHKACDSINLSGNNIFEATICNKKTCRKT